MRGSKVFWSKTIWEDLCPVINTAMSLFQVICFKFMSLCFSWKKNPSVSVHGFRCAPYQIQYSCAWFLSTHSSCCKAIQQLLQGNATAMQCTLEMQDVFIRRTQLCCLWGNFVVVTALHEPAPAQRNS